MVSYLSAPSTTLAKLTMVPLWCWFVGSFTHPEVVPVPGMAHIVFAVTLVAHAAQAVIFRKTFSAIDGAVAGHVAQTLIFGLAHTMPALAEARERGAANEAAAADDDASDA